MTVPQLGFQGKFCDKTLYLASKRGMLQIETAPVLRARRFDLKCVGGQPGGNAFRQFDWTNGSAWSAASARVGEVDRFPG